MAMLDRFLLCGVLLGVAFAAVPYPGAQHYSVRLGDDKFAVRFVTNPISQNTFRVTQTDKVCNEPAPNDGIFWLIQHNNQLDLVNGATAVVGGTTLSQGGVSRTKASDPILPATPGFYSKEGKFKLCFCESTFGGVGAKTCQNTPFNNQHDVDLGFLHVVASIPPIGLKLDQNYLGAPVLYLPLLSTSHTSVKASWIFSESRLNVDSMKIIAGKEGATTPLNGIQDSILAQCGQDVYDSGASPDQSIRTIHMSGTTESGGVSVCTNDNINLNTPRAVALGCKRNGFERFTTAFTPPPETPTPVLFAALCYCNLAHEGSCSSNSNFGAALGLVAFVKFASGKPNAHYTVSPNSPKEISMKPSLMSGMTLTTGDRVGLVRLDEPAEATDTQHNLGNWDYTTTNQANPGAPRSTLRRGCGWSNLDPFPLAIQQTQATQQFTFPPQQFPNQFVNDIVEVKFQPDMQARKYQICLCRTGFIWARAGQGKADNSGCPDPSMVEQTNVQNQVSSTNADQHWLNTLYADSLGFLHLVTPLVFPTSLMLQTGANTHITINFRSNVQDQRRYASYADPAGSQKWVGRRFYFVEKTTAEPSPCGVLGPSNLISNMGANIMYTRLHDASTTSQEINLDSSPTVPASTWGSLWSLTTGWLADSRKRGATATVASEKVQAAGTTISATFAADGKDFDICFCDATTEFGGSSFSSADKGSCSAALAKSDYSNFGATLGQAKVRKLAMHQPGVATAHFTVQKSISVAITLTPASAGSWNSGVVAPAVDRVIFIPAYGDGYGVDTENGIGPSNPNKHNPDFFPPVGGTTILQYVPALGAIDVEVNRPWKTDYYCGHANVGTRHSFNTGVIGGGVLPLQGDTTITNKFVTQNFDSNSYATKKMKVCYCSALAWGPCPSDSAANSDNAGTVAGWGNAQAYNDFAGYLHVVDSVSFPINSIAPAIVTGTGTLAPAYTMTWPPNTLEQTFDKVLYISTGSCGNQAPDSDLVLTPVAESATLLGNGDFSFLSVAMKTAAVTSKSLRICFCDSSQESLQESTDMNGAPTGRACNSATASDYGTDIGALSLGAFVFDRRFGDQHFTVQKRSAVSQTFTITKAAVTDTLTPATKVGVTEATADQLAVFVETDLSKQCGVHPLPANGKFSMGFISGDNVVTSPFDFSVSYNAHNLYVVCYCQVHYFGGKLCDVTDPKMWYQVGFLHVAEVEFWPQNFVIAIGRNAKPNTPTTQELPFIIVKFQTSSGWAAGDQFVIVGASRNSLSTNLTQACGVNPGLLEINYYKATRQNVNTKFEAVPLHPTWAMVDNWDSGTLTSNSGFIPNTATANDLGQWLGAGKGKTLCMCDQRERHPDKSVKTASSSCSQSATVWQEKDIAGYGLYLGKVWGAKTVTFTSDTSVRQHFTVKKAAGQTYTIVSRGPTEQTVHTNSDDTIAFATEARCGSVDLKLATKISVANNGLEALVYFDATSPALVPSSVSYAQKYAICYCRFAVTGSCDVANYFQFFENAGFVHILDAPVFPLLFTAQSSGASKLTVTFNSPPSTVDRFALITYWVAAGGVNPASPARGNGFFKCGQYEPWRNATGSIDPDLATLLGNKNMGAGTTNNHFFEVYGFDSTPLDPTIPGEYLSAQATTVSGNSLTSANVHLTQTKWQYRVCYCAAASENVPTCPSLSVAQVWPAAVSPASYYSSYGADLGILSVADFLTAGVNNQHFTVWRKNTTAQSLQILKIVADNVRQFSILNDRYAIIPETQSCGATTAFLDSKPFTSNTSYVEIFQKYSVCTGVTDHSKCQGLTANNLATSTLSGTYKVCLCAGTISATGTCDVLKAADWTDQAGFLHVFTGGANAQRASVNKLESDTFSIKFGVLDSIDTKDRFSLIPENSYCGDSRDASGVTSLSETTSLPYSIVSNLVQEVLLSPPVVSQNIKGVYRVCYCSYISSNNTACPSAQTPSNAFRYGAEVGVLVVNDVRLTPTFGTWSSSVEAKAAQPIFIHHDGQSIIENGDKAWFVKTGHSCHAVENQVLSTQSTDMITITNSDTEYTFNFNRALPGRDLWRLCVQPKTAVPARPIRDVASLGVYVVDATVTPTTAKSVTEAPLQLNYVSSLVGGSDKVWFRRQSVACGSAAPLAADKDGTSAVPLKNSGVSTMFDFSLINPLNKESFRLCVHTGNKVLDYFTVRVLVFDVLSVSPSSVKNTANQALTFTYNNALARLQDKVWFQRATASGGAALPCTFPAAGPSTSSSDAFTVQVAGTSSSFNFSSVPSSSLDQNQFRLCVQENVGKIHDYSPVGVWVIDVSVSPTNIKYDTTNSQKVKITYNYQNGAATGGSSLSLNDEIWFQKDVVNTPCSKPTTASATHSNAQTVQVSGSEYTFDFTQFAQTSVTNHDSFRLCVLSQSFSLPLSYSSVALQLVDIEIKDPLRPGSVKTSVIKGNNALILTQTTASTSLNPGRVWFRDETLECGSAIASTTSSTVSAVTGAQSQTITFDFSSVIPTQNLLRLCYIQDSAPTSTVDFPSVGVYLTDLILSPRSVLGANNQALTFSFSTASLTLQAGDLLQFRTVGTPCGTQLTNDGSTSSTAKIETTGAVQLFTSTKGVNSCPWKTVPWSTARFCDYRCTATDAKCWLPKFDFSKTVSTSSAFRVCVSALNKAGRVLDYDSVQIHLVDAAVRPTSVQVATKLMSMSFTGASGVGSASANSLVDPTDKVWFSSSLVPCASPCTTPCVLLAPAGPTSQVSSAVDYAQNKPNNVSFAAVSTGSQTPFKLCAQSTIRDLSGGFPSVRDYGSIGVFIIDVTIAPTSITFGTLSQSIKITYDSSTSGMSLFCCSDSITPGGCNKQCTVNGEIPQETDRIYFLSTVASCSATMNTAVSTKTSSSVVNLTVTTGQSLTFDFSNLEATSRPYRMCVVKTPDREQPEQRFALDYSSVAVTVTDAVVSPQAVRKSKEQILSIYLKSGLAQGDIFAFVKATTSCDNWGGLPASPNVASAVSTNWILMTDPIVSSPVVVTVDFSAAEVDNTPWRICLYTPEVRQAFTMKDLSGSGTQVFLLDVTLSTNVVRQADSQTLRISYVKSLKPGDGLCFETKSQTCSCNGAVVTANRTASTLIPASGNPTTWSFSQIRVSTEMMSMCILPGNAQPYLRLDVGVYVTDLMIGGSQEASTASCVRKAAAQVVSFSTSAPFGWSDKLFFRKSVSETGTAIPCGPSPDITTTHSSNAVQMVAVGTVGVRSWSMKFDFSAAVGDASPFRLCVDVGGAGGNFIDFDPFGVRVTDIYLFATNAVCNELTAQKSGKCASVKPLTAQRVTFAYTDKSIKPGDNIWFISSGDAELTCTCSMLGTCGNKLWYTPTVPVTDAGTFTATMDFSKFGAADTPGNSAYMCVSPSPSVAYALKCITIGFAATPVPSEVPSNDNQVLRLDFSGSTLSAGDKLLWVTPGLSCPENFATARDVSKVAYSSVATVSTTASAMVFNFSGMKTNADSLVLCVQPVTGTTFQLRHASSMLKLAQPVTVTPPVALYGDPHVRAGDGAWLDFYGEAGVYKILGGQLEANAKFGYAVRENFMIWHPKVMRPGTVVEEVGLKFEGGASLRLGVYGGGVVSIRAPGKATQFWTKAQDQSMTIGDYEITWESATSAHAMPWGMHERFNVLTVAGKGDFIQLFTAQSGGYHFIDVEAVPAPNSVGLLGDAQVVPELLAQSLKSGGESSYKVAAAALSR